VVLNSLGRAVGHQVRITQKDKPRFIALYTVKQANPPADLSDPSRANVIRTGQAGRERLGTTVEMKAVVHAKLVDAAPLPDEPIGVRFFEVRTTERKLTSSPSHRMAVQLKNTPMRRRSTLEKN